MFDFWTRSEEDRLIDAFERRSRLFIAAHRADDQAQMVFHSRKAWSAFAMISATVRRKFALARMDSADMNAPTSKIIDGIDESTAGFIASSRTLAADHPACRDADLRVTLYKLPRGTPNLSFYRIEDDNRHYLIRGGHDTVRTDDFWLIEVEVAKLCANLRTALKRK